MKAFILLWLIVIAACSPAKKFISWGPKITDPNIVVGDPIRSEFTDDDPPYFNGTGCTAWHTISVRKKKVDSTFPQVGQQLRQFATMDEYEHYVESTPANKLPDFERIVIGSDTSIIFQVW